MKRCADEGYIKCDNVLVVNCQGDHCGGRVRIPFTPGLNGAPGAQPLANGTIWRLTGGSSIDDITLVPSVKAIPCGHFDIQNGEIKSA